MNNNTEIKRPDFDLIIAECNKAITKAFPKRGNSWERENTKNYWTRRISNELYDFECEISHCGQKRKLINLINFCAMTYHIINDDGTQQ